MDKFYITNPDNKIIIISNDLKIFDPIQRNELIEIILYLKEENQKLIEENNKLKNGSNFNNL